MDSFQKRSFFPLKDKSLPVSKPDSSSSFGGDQPGLLRRRLSNLSFTIQPISSSSSWRFPRSKSVSAMGEQAGSSMRRWWEWGWSWIMSRKPIFTRDLEMNKEEARALGSHNRGSLMHVFFKVRSEVRKLLGSSSDNVGLPLSCRITKG